ncbi:hypothetical protein [Kingella oralis]|uniref:hypothetical protein n=1 Tax=Kingella oralis TaxID=505 RepID=UPI0034E41613
MPDLLGFRLHWRGVECEPQARTRFWVGNGVGGKAMRPFLDDASWGDWAFGKSFSRAV